MTICRKHKLEYHDSPVGECPVCVRDERDKLRSIFAEKDGFFSAWDEATEDAKVLLQERDQLRQEINEYWSAKAGEHIKMIAELEKERDQAVRDADGAVELAEALHMCQQERDRLRELIPQAWNYASDLALCDGQKPEFEYWAKHKGLA